MISCGKWCPFFWFHYYRESSLESIGPWERITSEWMDLIVLRPGKTWLQNSMTQKIISKDFFMYILVDLGIFSSIMTREPRLNSVYSPLIKGSLSSALFLKNHQSYQENWQKIQMSDDIINAIVCVTGVNLQDTVRNISLYTESFSLYVVIS